jgi:hypothetical protein
MLQQLSSLNNVSEKFETVVQHPPLIKGDSIPEYWCRVEKDGTYYLFLAQPFSKDLKYPVYSGQSLMKQSVFRDLEISINGKIIRKKFRIQTLSIAPAKDYT